MPETDGIRELHQTILDAWNRQNAPAFAAAFAPDGTTVGFDGSPIDGREDIEAHLGKIFADHQTASYVAVVREVRLLGADVGLLRAAVGMVPPGQNDINPDTNAIQGLVAVRGADGWEAALLQNTPAAFHGRPSAAEAMTAELRNVLAAGR